MRFYFHGCRHLCFGLRELESALGFALDCDGMPLSATQADGSDIEVSYKGGVAHIVYSRDIHFFRAFGLLIERLREGASDFVLRETPQFETNGAMLDVSQGNAALNLRAAKEMIRRMAVMGLNMLMFYCEDSFTVESQPYFGYMRARYTEEDFRDLDDYAFAFGIELIPCVQTLAHLPAPLNWAVYDSIKEDETTLLPGCDETYRFIEDLLVAASRPFRSRRIHIGMDEAWKLGRGQYLTKNGYVPPDQIMRDHLSHVMEIVRRLGLKPMMWSDMFFRAILKDGMYYSDDVTFPDRYFDTVPRDVSMIYWDYYHEDQAFYDRYIAKHRELGEPIFAGGIWTWYGFGLNWSNTEMTTRPALLSCKKNGIKEVFATVWGDNGTECNVFAILPGLTLFAEHGYDANPSSEKIQKRFNFCTGGVFEDFTNLRYLDEIPGVPHDAIHSYNASKYLMWQDILTGLFDKNIEGLPLAEHYVKIARKYREAAGRNGAFSGLFAFSAQVADVLAIKGDLGVRITAAYRADDRELLHTYTAEILPLLSEKVKMLRAAHKSLWFDTYKPFGWDVMDMRYGALLIRIQSAAEELTAWLEGKLDRIEELDEPRLPFDGREGLASYVNAYGRIVSASQIAPNA